MTVTDICRAVFVRRGACPEIMVPGRNCDGDCTVHVISIVCLIIPVSIFPDEPLRAQHLDVI
jgi:hypothetical protein